MVSKKKKPQTPDDERGGKIFHQNEYSVFEHEWLNDDDR